MAASLSRASALDVRADSFSTCCTSYALRPARLHLRQQQHPQQHRMCTKIRSEQASKTDEYNRAMQRQMLNPYEYHHELGMYLTQITSSIIVGSQPQSREDIDRLHHEYNVGAVLNLQQDKDVQYWGIDINSVVLRCKELGILHMRKPARDFDAHSLRQELPKAVSALDRALSEGRIVYVHCTAGLGRAPAVVIAYLFWFQNVDLAAAYDMVTWKRPCGPKKEAIRGATYDLAKGDSWKPPFEDLPEHAFTGVVDSERQLIQQKVRSAFS